MYQYFPSHLMFDNCVSLLHKQYLTMYQYFPSQVMFDICVALLQQTIFNHVSVLPFSAYVR